MLRDTDRNLKVFQFVADYAETEELAWALLQFTPQVLMIHTRAVASQFLQTEEYAPALKEISEGIGRLREFYESHGRHDLMSQSTEISGLEHWMSEVEQKRPLTKREQLEKDLHEAVKREDYEKAAKVRDALKNLKRSD